MSEQPKGVNSAMLESMAQGRESNSGSSQAIPGTGDGQSMGGQGMGAKFTQGSIGSSLGKASLTLGPTSSIEGILPKFNEGGGAFGQNMFDIADGSVVGPAVMNKEGALPQLQGTGSLDLAQATAGTHKMGDLSARTTHGASMGG